MKNLTKKQAESKGYIFFQLGGGAWVGSNTKNLMAGLPGSFKAKTLSTVLRHITKFESKD